MVYKEFYKRIEREEFGWGINSNKRGSGGGNEGKMGVWKIIGGKFERWVRNLENCY